MVTDSSPFFSIIIPSFNAESVIGNAIRSILSQTYKNFEIFVADGQSSDKTIQIVAGFHDSRLKYVSDPDDGIYDAMNKGIRATTGNWLMFLGADDRLYEHGTLELLSKVIVDNPSTRFVYGNVMTSDNYVQRYNDYDYSKLLDICICHQSIIYHRSLFDNCMYDMRYQICADWDFNLKVFRSHNRPFFVDRPLAYFHLGGASSNWFNHPEYVSHFSDRKELILRYRGMGYLCYFSLNRCVRKIIFLTKKMIKNSFLAKVLIDSIHGN